MALADTASTVLSVCFIHSELDFGNMAWVPPAEIAGNSTKIPPVWDPANEERYPFRSWLQDVTMWAAATDLFPQQIGPSMALRVAGPAREILRDIPVQQLQNGAMVD